ncbi:MAG: citrate (Si)-synthase [Bacteroidetes bacterium]|nr:citrate (Si)-synthase [Bacteroidota bacterium]
MDILKKKFREKADALRIQAKSMLKEYGNEKIDEVSIRQVFGGARGIKMMVWETSELDAIDGIRFRGYTIPELRKLLPKGPDNKEPRPEGLFWLMLLGEIPTKKQVDWLTDQWTHRSNVPPHTFKVLDSMPEDTHPMTQFSAAIVSMQSESCFVRRFEEGIDKADYWDPTYEDAMNLIARLPRIAAYIYRRTYHNGDHIAPDISQDWAGNFAHMLGMEQPTFKNLMRLYMTVHADHEGGNASAHTTHLVGSTLSDPYLSFASGMNALAGPLHGLANQEVIRWVFKLVDALGTRTPTKEQIADYVHSTLAAGQVIPGYGHAVLRRPDPRFVALRTFAEEYIPDDDIVQIVWKIFEVVPDILKGLGKVKNPWPNVDAHSGALLVHYGLTEYSFYTVLFGVSRALGVLSGACWSRALGMPIERPKSVTIARIMSIVEEMKRKAKS